MNYYEPSVVFGSYRTQCRRPVKPSEEGIIRSSTLVPRCRPLENLIDFLAMTARWSSSSAAICRPWIVAGLILALFAPCLPVQKRGKQVEPGTLLISPAMTDSWDVHSKALGLLSVHTRIPLPLT